MRVPVGMMATSHSNEAKLRGRGAAVAPVGSASGSTDQARPMEARGDRMIQAVEAALSLMALMGSPLIVERPEEGPIDLDCVPIRFKDCVQFGSTVVLAF